ncbi:MAG: hypothetical protein J6M20_06060 [Clostridia bacterium]|nr:hypothetical protein [Clostridia bacterium]
MALKKQCVLEEKECIGCGECDRCDLDPNKICDNCMKCINSDAEYRAIMVDDFELEAEFEAKQAGEFHHHDCDCGCDYDHHHHH